MNENRVNQECTDQPKTALETVENINTRNDARERAFSVRKQNLKKQKAFL